MSVQAGSAEKTAVTTQDAPLDESPFSAYASGLANGGFNVCTVPPHELETVSTPVVGGLVNETLPVTA